MKLPQRTVADPRAQENFEQIAKFMPDLLGKPMEINAGTVSLTFSASALASVSIVQHKLGRVPKAVFVASWTGSGHDGHAWTDIPSFTDTSFPVSSRAEAAWTGSVTTMWIAVG